MGQASKATKSRKNSAFKRLPKYSPEWMRKLALHTSLINLQYNYSITI